MLFGQQCQLCHGNAGTGGLGPGLGGVVGRKAGSVAFGYSRAILDAQGNPTGEYEDFLTGFVVNDTAVWGRPVGVATAHDGAVLVSEDGNGTIWRVAPR